MKKNVASQVVGAQMCSATDGSAFTGTVTVYVVGNAGTQAIGSVGSGVCTHEGNGFHTYAPAQAETNYDHVAFTFTGTGAIASTVQIYPSFPQTVDNATNISAIKTKTDSLTFTVANVLDSNTLRVGGTVQTARDIGANVLLSPGTGTGQLSLSSGAVLLQATQTGVTIPTVTNVTNAPTAGDFTATMKTSIGTAVAASAVASVTGNVGGNVTGSVGSVATGGITAASIATDALGAVELAADAVTEIATGVWAAGTRTLTAGTNIVLNKGTGLTGLTDLDAAGVRTAVGLATANLDTQIGTLATGSLLGTVASYIDTEVAAIKAKTDNLPADPADASDIAAALATIAGYVDTEVAAIKGVTDKLDTALEADGGVYRFTTNALEQAPVGGGGGATDWTSDERTAIRSILGVPASGTTPDDPTTGILDTIRDAAAAVKAKTDNLPTDPADASDIAASFSTVNGTLGTIAGYLDTEVAAIKAKTDNLPASPASAGDVAAVGAALDAGVNVVEWNGTTPGNLDSNGFLPANLASINGDSGRVGAFADQLDADEIGAIKAKTDNLPADPADGSEVAALIDAITVPTVDEIWDEVVEGSVTARQSMRLQNAAMAGKAFGLDTTDVTFRDLSDTKNRIVAVVTPDGNRTAVTLDLT